MKLLSNAKINLGLNVTEKRADGFHILESLFLPVPWYDEIEIVESQETTFSSSGIAIDGAPESNLCLQAFKLLTHDFTIPPVEIHLKKQIPIGAGLGGGSSNAAFVLKGLNDLFGLNLGKNQLRKYADQLGSDCSFFIDNQSAFVSGKGEIVDTNYPFDISTFCLMVNPGIQISTKEAYSRIVPKMPTHDLRTSLQLPISDWQGKVKNDFEEALLPHYPELRQLKSQLQERGASYVSMSGSGSTFFAFFEEAISAVDFPKGYQWRAFQLEI